MNLDHVMGWIKSHPIEGLVVGLLLTALTLAVEGHEMMAAILTVGAIGLGAYKYWEEISTVDWRAWLSAVSGSIDAYSVKEWHSASVALEKFSQTAARDAAQAKLDALRTESQLLARKLPPGRMSVGRTPPPLTEPMPEDEKALRVELDQLNRKIRDTEAVLLSERGAIVEQIRAQLISGTLIGKGAPVVRNVAQSHRVIPKLRWVILKFNFSDATAWGHGWSYVGLLIGKRGH